MVIFFYFYLALKLIMGHACYECSTFQEDEIVGRCPGWQRNAISHDGFPCSNCKSIYDGCATLYLNNGTIIAQHSVIYNQCLNGVLQVNLTEIQILFNGLKSMYICCYGSHCNNKSLTSDKNVESSANILNRFPPKLFLIFTAILKK